MNRHRGRGNRRRGIAGLARRVRAASAALAAAPPVPAPPVAPAPPPAAEPPDIDQLVAALRPAAPADAAEPARVPPEVDRIVTTFATLGGAEAWRAAPGTDTSPPGAERRHQGPPAREKWPRAEAVDRRGLIYAASALFVALLVFAVLALLERRDLLTSLSAWP